MTNALASTLDWPKLELTEVAFGDHYLAIPPGSQHYEHTEHVTYNGVAFDVHIEISLNLSTGVITAHFDSIDPLTGLPPQGSSTIGFLPPENGTGRGQGHISYVIRSKPGLTTGMEIRNVASITFDPLAGGATYRTDLSDPTNPNSPSDPNRQALVTIDANPPTGSVSALPTNTSSASFAVKWSGTDVGSGVDGYDIYVRVDAGTWTLWQSNTAATSATYSGQSGHTYGFYAAVRDGAGNSRPAPSGATAADAQTTVTVSPLSGSHAVAGPGYLPGGTVTITNTITYTGTLSSLIWHVRLPTGEGWTYASGGGSEGDIKPAAGTAESLDWSWTTVPPSPVTFTYTLNIPANAAGTKTITALLTGQQSGSPLQAVAQPDPLTINRGGASLTSLLVSAGSLTPPFASANTDYTVAVPDATTTMTVTPTASDSTATVKVNGTTVVSGNPSAAIPLNVGSNVINIVVTAQDGTTTKTYIVTVTRGGNGLSPSITSSTAASAYVGSPFSFQITASNGPTSFGVTGLPAGLSLNSNTGVISGTTKAAAGIVTVSVTASNLFGTGTGTVMLNVQTIAAWGDNSSGQTNIPTGLDKVVATAAGFFHSLALKSDGTVAGWGNNSYGQTTIPIALNNVVAVAAGFGHSLALKSDGTVTGWGDNTSGQTTLPVEPGNAVAIAAGWYHSLALKSDGTVVGWGSNSNGQTAMPPGLNNVVAIAAGWRHSLALKSDGTVVAWGDNGFGQTAIPTGLVNVVTIATGALHNLALKSDGTVVGWGSNSYGETTIPTGLNNVVSIATGGNHNLALKSDGTVVSWGSNGSGETSIPAGLANVAAIAAGSSHSLALMATEPGIASPVIISPRFALGGFNPFSYRVWAKNGPTSYGATGLPAGLSINTATGMISGTPEAGGTFTITLSAANVSGTGTATLSLTVNGATGDIAFVTSTMLGTLRNDFTGWIGMQIIVGANPLTVSQLGRIVATGNSGTHVVKMVKAIDGTDVPGGSVAVAMIGGTPGQFRYGVLGSPVTLAAKTAYWVLSQETTGGDTWYDWDTTVTTTGDAAVIGLAWGSGPGGWSTYAVTNHVFVPVNFRYSVVTAATAYVTGDVPGTVRNDYSGWVGMQIAVGASPLTVSELGRITVTGNSGTHTVKLVKASDGMDVPGGSVSVATSGGTAGQFRYGVLGSPVTLAANTTYWVLSQETAGGDTWYDWNTTLTTTGVAAANGIVWGTGPGAWSTYPVANQAFVPVNFKYTTATAATVYVTGNVPGTVRNDYSGWVGMQFAVGASPLTVSELGRITASGNSGTHIVKLVKASDGSDVSGGSVSVAMSGGTTGQFRYGVLGSPVTLAAGATYWLLSQETAGGDSWYDWNTILTTTGVAAANGIVWGTGPGAWSTYPVANQAFVPVNFKYTTAAAATAYVTGNVPGMVRNDYSGWVGMQFAVGAGALTVSELGRITASGNSGTHIVKLVKASDGMDVPGGSASVAMSGGTTGQFRYGVLGSPVTLAAGTTYWVLSQETAGGDSWYDWNTTLTTTGVAAANGIVWGTGPGSWSTYPVANQAFAPVNFKYTTSISTTPYITSAVPGTLRNDYSGWVGMQIRVGANPLNVAELGRFVAPGNSGTHAVKLVRASDGADVPGGTAAVATNGATPGQFRYVVLGSPVTLAAGTTYWLLSQESATGDMWYDWNTTLTTTGVATAVGLAWGTGLGGWATYSVPNQSWVPVNFKY